MGLCGTKCCQTQTNMLMDDKRTISRSSYNSLAKSNSSIYSRDTAFSSSEIPSINDFSIKGLTKDLGESTVEGYQSLTSNNSLKSSSGKSQSVYLIKHKLSGKDFLMKISKLKKASEEEREEDSFDITKAITSSYIVKVYYELKSETKKYIIYDYLPCGLLCNYFVPNKSLQEDRIKFYANQILCDYEFPEECSQDLKDLILILLDLNADKKYKSINEIRKHEFFNDCPKHPPFAPFIQEEMIRIHHYASSLKLST